MPTPLRKMVERLGSHPSAEPQPVATHADLQSMRTWATEESAIASANGRGREARAYGQVVEAIDGAYQRASAPYVPEGRPRTEGDILRAETDEAAGQHPDLAQALQSEPGAASAADVRAARREEKSLVQYLVENGGLDSRTGRGDLLATLGEARARPGLVNNQQRRTIRDPVTGATSTTGGMNPEQALTKLIEDGYFDDMGATGGPGGSGTGAAASQGSFGPGGPTVDDLYAAIGAELRGEPPRYALGSSPLRDQIAGQDGARADLEAEVQRRGGSLESSPEETLRTLRQVSEEPAGMDRPPDDPMVAAPLEAVTEREAALLRDGQAHRIQQAADFETGAAARAARADDSAKAATFFHAGQGGPEAAGQFLRGMGDRPAAVAALESHAATSLRDFATKAGTDRLDAARVQVWLDRHRGALAQFPELAERFRTARSAMAEVETKLGARTASVQEMENGVASYFLKGTNPQAAIETVLRSHDVARGTRGLMALVGHDGAAVRGLRRAYVEALLEKAGTTGSLPNAQGEAVQGLSSAAFQRQLKATRGAAGVLFDPASLRRLENVAEDFRSGSMYQRANGVSGSPTGQNLSMAYLLGRASQGQSNTGGLAGGVFNSTLGRAYTWALKHQGPLVQRLIMEAAVDPRMQARIMRAAKPGDGDALLSWGATNGSPGLRESIAAAGIRASGRANTAVQSSEEPEPEERARGGQVGYAYGGEVAQLPNPGQVIPPGSGAPAPAGGLLAAAPSPVAAMPAAPVLPAKPMPGLPAISATATRGQTEAIHFYAMAAGLI